jgi:hypothetical protein
VPQRAACVAALTIELEARGDHAVSAQAHVLAEPGRGPPSETSTAIAAGNASSSPLSRPSTTLEGVEQVALEKRSEDIEAAETAAREIVDKARADAHDIPPGRAGSRGTDHGADARGHAGEG